MQELDLLKKRELFFEKIINIMFREDITSSEKLNIEDLFGISKYIKFPNKEEIFCKPEYGELVIPLRSEYFDKKFEIIYSLWQIGEELKVGFLIKQDSILDVLLNEKEVFEDMYDKSEYKLSLKYDGVFAEWFFNVKGLYENYESQEYFIMRFRHMHINLLRTLYKNLK